MTIEKATGGIPRVPDTASPAAGETVRSDRPEKKSVAQRIQAAIDAVRDVSTLLPSDFGYDLRTILQLVGAAISAGITPARLGEMIAEEGRRNRRR